MIIPPKIILTGNEKAASEYIGLGKKMLRFLGASMAFQSLPTGKFIQVIDEFTTIEVKYTYGLPVIVITSEEPEEPEGGELSCYCKCGVSVGATPKDVHSLKETIEKGWIPPADPPGSLKTPVWKTVEAPTIKYYATYDVIYCRLDNLIPNKETEAMDWYDYEGAEHVYGIVCERELIDEATGSETTRELIDAQPCTANGALKIKRNIFNDLRTLETREDDLRPISIEVQGGHRTVDDRPYSSR